MTESFLPFAKPHINQAAIDEVVACLESGWLTTGPRVAQFETDLKNYFNAPFALSCNSATAGLHMALLALDLQAGDEVITTPLTFIASLNTIVLAGATPVLVDIESDTLNLDVHQVAAAITPRTKAIMPVHFAGLPCDCDAIYALAKQYELRVIEDCAHAMGARFKNQLLGSFGDTQVFSFHPNKNMTTGEGGCVITRDAHMAKRIEQLRFHGIDRTIWDRNKNTGNQHYDVVLPGFKYNMLDIQAALGIHQLAQLDNFNQRRNQLAQQYLGLLADSPWLDLPQAPSYAHTHAWHLFTPRLKRADRDSFIQAMKAQQIGIGLHYEAAHLYQYYRDTYGFKRGDFPHAESAAEHIVSLPLFPDMQSNDVSRVVTTLTDILNRI